MAESNDMPRTGCEDIAERLRIASLALDAALDAIIVHRVDGTLVHFNEAAAAGHGMTHDEFAALPPWGWTTYSDPALRDARLAKLCEEGQASFRNPWVSPEGRTRWMEIHARCVQSDHDTLIVAVLRDVTKEVRATEVLEHLAFHDPLTGLANRASLDIALTSAIAGVRRHGDRLGVAYLDLDDFKDVNDSLGHHAGDQVLITLAERLRRSVRPDDTIARLGGDEFAIVLPRLGPTDELEAVAQRFVTLIEEPVIACGRAVRIRASIGIAVFDPDVDDAHSLVMKADLAMYAAKHANGRAWLVYSDEVASGEGFARR